MLSTRTAAVHTPIYRLVFYAGILVLICAGALLTVRLKPWQAASSDTLLGQVVNGYLEAQSRADADAALEFLTDDAVLEAAPPDVCSAPNPCVGKRTIGTAFLSRIVHGHPQLTPIEQVVEGDSVTTRVEVRNDGVHAAGFDRYIVTTSARISGDKIASFKVVRDLDDAETATFDQFQRSHR